MTELPDLVVQRTATRLGGDNGEPPRSLVDWRDAHAYVLLGEPGSGKSTTFLSEALAMGARGRYLTARTFLTLAPASLEEGTVLFIDALDERLIGASDVTSPFDEIRKRLKDLGRPSFRLSCREADWLRHGAQELEEAVPGTSVFVLRLDPLSDQAIGDLLRSWTPERLSDPAAFVAEARSRNLDHLLRNPLLLDLLVKAVHGDHWPDSRQEIYRLACDQLALEQNDAHRDRRLLEFSTAELMRAAGLVCASVLLSDRPAISLDADGFAGDLISIDALASGLSLDPRLLKRTLNSKLFVAEGQDRLPRHRTIAEFVGAQALSDLTMRDGLPLRRMTALMVGHDDRVVDSLRGLHAWLASLNHRDRDLLIERDPLGLILYGDVRELSLVQKERVLRALYREATRYRWFRRENRADAPFGALGTPDMASTFRSWLADPARNDAHQVTLECVLHAIHHGAPFDELLGDVERVFRDGSYWWTLRGYALMVLLVKAGFKVERSIRLLDEIRRGKISDDEDRLTGLLLHRLYPDHIDAKAALRYLRPRGHQSHVGDFQMFWIYHFPRVTPRAWWPEIADDAAQYALRAEVLDDEDGPDRRFDLVRQIVIGAVARALEVAGDDVDLDRLLLWLKAVHGKYGHPVHGSDLQAIQSWLAVRPATIAELYRLVVSRVQAEGPDGARALWQGRSILLGTAKPRDWFRRVLMLAQQTKRLDEAIHFVREAAWAAADPEVDNEVTMEEIEQWVRANADQWPDVARWVEDATTLPLEPLHPAGQFHRRDQEIAQQRADRFAQRQRTLAPLLPSLGGPEANVGLLYQVAGLYRAAQRDSSQGSATDRIAMHLVAGPPEAAAAIQGIRASLSRTDLPSAQEIFECHQQNRHYWVELPCLLAAEHLYEVDAAAVARLDERVIETLVAIYAVQSCSESDGWFQEICRVHPQLVAKVLVAAVADAIRTPTNLDLQVLYRIADSNAPSELARLALPTWIEALPDAPTTPNQLHLMDGVLLRGGRRHLDPAVFQAALQARLRRGGSEVLRVSLHVALLSGDAGPQVAALEALCTAHDRTIHLAQAISGQQILSEAPLALTPMVVGRLARLLLPLARRAEAAPIASGVDEHDMAFVGERLLGRLWADPSREAAGQLRALHAEFCSTAWLPYLEHALHEQAEAARIANFRPPTIEAVCRVLSKGAPATPRDLAELLRDQLMLVAERIQRSEANLLECFYRLDEKGRSIPKIENDCRDVLLGLVEDRLAQQGVSFDKEAQEAGDRRADFRGTLVRGQRMHIPIEVKKDNHSEVWTAWRNQLQKRYATHPSAGGIGMYLVLWFGVKTKPSPAGTRPRSALQMAEMFDEQILEPNRSHLIGLVVDLSRQLRA